MLAHLIGGMMGTRRYGRGKFDAHENYIQYMEEVVDTDAFRGMPNAKEPDGHVNWQVSSGKNTSFHEYYQERFDWWVSKADALGLPGSGNERSRFTIAARLNHPTGYRPCRLCGTSVNVGYFYLNRFFANRLNKRFATDSFGWGQPMTDAIDALGEVLPEPEVQKLLLAQFPERRNAILEFGASGRAFEVTNHIRTRNLSPGFMGNPPDRLDGFHDYCLFCRADNDPGRSRENLRSYARDRRAFYWWSEGDWMAADTLFNAAGAGVCSICGKHVERVSPDHVGPLSCGFKQIPYFEPLCSSCNSSKNRRMTYSDVRLLIQFEEESGNSVASRQVKVIWDAMKQKVSSDQDAETLSTLMRSAQDVYLHALCALYEAGRARTLVVLLRPDYALFDVSFAGLDRATLTYRAMRHRRNASQYRVGLAGRTVRVAFESLVDYTSKAPAARKLLRATTSCREDITSALRDLAAEVAVTAEDSDWAELLADPGKESDADVAALLAEYDFLIPGRDEDEAIIKSLDSLMAQAQLDLLRSSGADYPD